jgi:hypothetical protein
MADISIIQQIAKAQERAQTAPIAILNVLVSDQAQVTWEVSSESYPGESYHVTYRDGILACNCPACVVCKHIGKVLLSGASYREPAEKYAALKQVLRAGLAQIASQFDRFFNRILSTVVLPDGYRLVRRFDERLLLVVWNVVRDDGIAIMARSGFARAYATERAAIVAANRSARMRAIIARHIEAQAA